MNNKKQQNQYPARFNLCLALGTAEIIGGDNGRKCFDEIRNNPNTERVNYPFHKKVCAAVGAAIVIGDNKGMKHGSALLSEGVRYVAQHHKGDLGQQANALIQANRELSATGCDVPLRKVIMIDRGRVPEYYDTAATRHLKAALETGNDELITMVGYHLRDAGLYIANRPNHVFGRAKRVVKRYVNTLADADLIDFVEALVKQNLLDDASLSTFKQKVVHNTKHLDDSTPTDTADEPSIDPVLENRFKMPLGELVPEIAALAST